MRSRFQHLKIDAYNSRLASKDSKSCSTPLSACITLIKPDMCDEEKRIHSYLDNEQIFLIEIKEALSQQVRSNFDSPRLASEFNRRGQLVKRQHVAGSGHKSSFHEKLEKLSCESREQSGCRSEQPLSSDNISINSLDSQHNGRFSLNKCKSVNSENKFKNVRQKKSTFYLNQQDTNDDSEEADNMCDYDN
eukprot:403364533